MGPLPGTNWDPSLGQTGRFLLNSTVKSPFCPVRPWDGWGFVPGTIVPQGPSDKCLCVFCLLVFFSPLKRGLKIRFDGAFCSGTFAWCPKQGGPGSVRLRFGDGTVPAVPVFGSGGSSKEGGFCVVQYSLTERTVPVLVPGISEIGSGGSGSAFGSWENGSDGSGLRFRFGSWTALPKVHAKR